MSVPLSQSTIKVNGAVVWQAAAPGTYAVDVMGMASQITVIADPALAGLTIVNIDTGQDVGPFAGGELPQGARISVRADPKAGTGVASVKFALDGAAPHVENVAPYAIAGDASGKYAQWTPAVGAHTLIVTPYGAANATGTAGQPLTVKFNVVAPAPPPPPIVVGPSPYPLVNPGDSIESGLSQGSRLLQPGAVYRLTNPIDVTAAGRTLATADPAAAKPIIEVPGNFRALSIVGKTNFTLDGIEVRSTYTTHTEAGVWGYNAPGLRILNSWIHGFNKGASIQADSIAAGGDFFVWDSWLRDNTRQYIGGKDYHGEGIYCDKVRYDIRRVHLDHNGWREGQTSRDIYSHNFYAQGTCADGGVFVEVVSNDAASHGTQLRAGGTFARYLSLNCPVGFSYGLVNNSMIHPGGVKGALSDIWVLGCPEVSATLKPGWAGEFGNILDVTANGVYADGDDLGISAAFLVHACRAPENAGYIGVKNLVLNGLCAPKWVKGVLAEQDGLHATSHTTIQPPKYADLRAALGGAEAFLNNVRGKPSTASATGLALLHAAWGIAA